MDELVNEIIAELTTELKKNCPVFDADILANKVKGAYRKVRSRKCYENTPFSEQQINEDLKLRHYQDISDMALYDFAKIGGYFETSHSENSISRTWRTEDEILGNIVAFVGIF